MQLGLLLRKHIKRNVCDAQNVEFVYMRVLMCLYICLSLLYREQRKTYTNTLCGIMPVFTCFSLDFYVFTMCSVNKEARGESAIGSSTLRKCEKNRKSHCQQCLIQSAYLWKKQFCWKLLGSCFLFQRHCSFSSLLSFFRVSNFSTTTTTPSFPIISNLLSLEEPSNVCVEREVNVV